MADVQKSATPNNDEQVQQAQRNFLDKGGVVFFCVRLCVICVLHCLDQLLIFRKCAFFVHAMLNSAQLYLYMHYYMKHARLKYTLNWKYCSVIGAAAPFCLCMQIHNALARPVGALTQIVCFPSLFRFFNSVIIQFNHRLLSCAQFNKCFNKLKHDLEAWREIVLVADTVFKWDKPAFAGIVAAIVTIGYILVWWMDLSVLTLVSLIGIAIVVLDYGYPIVSRMIFRPENWTGAQEKRYEQTCRELCTVRLAVCSVCHALFVDKEEKSTKVKRTCFFLLNLQLF